VVVLYLLKLIDTNVFSKMNMIGKEGIFKGKKEIGDKVDALDGFDLSDKIVAMLVGSTPDSVKTARSKKKKEIDGMR